jgi:hypothetical protein
MSEPKNEPAAEGGAPPKPKPAPAPAPGPKGPTARVCHENDRAKPGLKRFRVRAVGSSDGNTGGAMRPVGLYILAPTAEAARACYLTAEANQLKAAGFGGRAKDGTTIEPHLRVDELPD